jgi:hypothetical protein
MFMVLGPLLFLALIGSALLGVAMLLVAVGLWVRPAWRKWGAVMLCVGLGGGVLGSLALFTLKWPMGNVQTPPETWVLFTAAGFGWASLLAAAALALLESLRLPNRWADRRKNLRASLGTAQPGRSSVS